MGTAPRSPAHEMNACWAHGMRNHDEARRPPTAAGRRSSSAPPTTSAGPSASSSRAGETSRPSSTNSPIWASEAMPSAKPMLADRCGSAALPSTTPHR